MSARWRAWSVGLALLGLHARALALSCEPPPQTVDERIAQHDLIFVGTARRASGGCGRPPGVPPTYDGEVWEFDVSEGFVGVEPGETQLLGTDPESSFLAKGESYLVYTNAVELSGVPWGTWGSVCDVGGLAEEWEPDIEVLRERFGAD